MNVELDNLLIFNDFKLSMSYPKKIVGSTIPEECLSQRPSFRYKKLIMLMGANATGKTALGKVIMACFNFITNKNYTAITELIDNKKRDAKFTLDIAFTSNVLYRIDAVFKAKEDIINGYESEDITVRVTSEPILSKDSYERCLERLLLKSVDGASNNYITELEKVPLLSWCFDYSFTAEGLQRAIKPLDQDLYVKVLEKTLQTLDPTIDSVDKIPNVENTYVIFKGNTTIIIKNGEIIQKDVLSSGTAEGIDLADIISSLKLGAYDFYYCDEKFAHLHTDIEKAFISLFIELMGQDRQLFITLVCVFKKG